MDKNFLIKSIDNLVASCKLWNEMSEHIFALGGEIFETKFIEAFNYHEELVFDLIRQVREPLIPNFDAETEYSEFQEYIFDLARGYRITIYDCEGTVIGHIDSTNDLYNFLLEPNEFNSHN